MSAENYGLISDIYDVLANNTQYCTSKDFADCHEIDIDYQNGIINIDNIVLTISNI